MLTIQDLSYATDSGKTILDRVSLTVQPGEIVGLVGGSGSGKSTLFHSVFADLYPRKSGAIEGRIEISPQGFDRDKKEAPQGRSRFLSDQKLSGRIQPVFQDAFSSFNPHWTMEDCLLEPFRIASIPLSVGREKILKWLPRIAMTESDLHKKPGEFSGGQNQRFAILRAILTEPEYLLMDEPVSGLDPLVRAKVLELVLQIQRDCGIGILFISHNLDVVRNICHRLYVLYRGRIVEEGEVPRIFENPLHPYTRELLGKSSQW